MKKEITKEEFCEKTEISKENGIFLHWKESQCKFFVSNKKIYYYKNPDKTYMFYRQNLKKGYCILHYWYWN